MTEAIVADIRAKASELGFSQQGDLEGARFVGALVRLVQPRRVLERRVLELGTGLGFTTIHILSNIGENAILDSVERDATLVGAATALLPRDPRLRLHEIDGEAFIQACAPDHYDVVFADTWPGKYALLAETLALVRSGGLYIVDDMSPREGWTADHAGKARSLLKSLKETRGWDFAFLPHGSGLAFGVRARPS